MSAAPNIRQLPGEFKLTLVGQEYNAVIYKASYMQDGSLALVASLAETGEPLTRISTFLSHNPPSNHNCFWCKDYSENEGIGEQLIKLGIAKKTGRRADSGFVFFEEYELMPAYQD